MEDVIDVCDCWYTYPGRSLNTCGAHNRLIRGPADASEGKREPQQPVLPALRGVSLTLRPGELVAAVGPNGSGKSTLALLLNGLLLPDRGQILVDGEDTRDIDRILQVRSRVGLVRQNPDNQLVAAIVEEDVAFGPENLGLPREEIRNRVEESLAAVGLTGLHQRPTHLLSGGQKQRLAIAGALAMRPTYLVLDEPTSMLDPRGRTDVLEAIKRLNGEFGFGIFYVTHDLEEAVTADRVLVFSGGRIVLEGTPGQIFTPDRAHFLYSLGLDLPFAAAVTAWLEEMGLDLGQPQAVPDLVEALASRVPALSPLPDRHLPENPVKVKAKRPQNSEVAPGMAKSLVSDLQKDSQCQATRLKDVVFTYRAGTPLQVKALEGISLAVPAGEVVGLIGATGSGKSTLVQLLNGLLRPQGGEVAVLGLDLAPGPKARSAWSRLLREVRQTVGLVFQYPEDQLFEQTVYADVAFGPRCYSLSEPEVEGKVRWALEAVKLDFDSFKNRSPFSLSGGEKRRVALAGVLALQPRLLILDEPTAGLDPAGRQAVLNLVRDLSRTQGLTVLLISHRMEDITAVCSLIFVLKAGYLVAAGPPDEIFSSGQVEALASWGLDLPPMAQMINLLRQRGLSVSLDLSWDTRSTARFLASSLLQ